MDSELMRELLQDQMRRVRGYLIRLGANRSDAEDIVQDTVYKGFLYIDSIEPDHFSAWMFKVALNGYYDLCRKNKRIFVPLDTIECFEDGEIPEEALLQKEKKEGIERALNELTPIYRQLIIMKYEWELSYKEIAECLDITVDKVKTYLFRARKQFQNIYGRQEP